VGEWLREYIDKVLSPKQAWIAVLFGGIALAFIYFQVWPLATGEAITAPVAGLLLLIGIATLVVSGGEWVMNKAIGISQKRRAARENDETAARLDEEAHRNLDALTDLEARQLQWILHAGRKRFDLPVEYGLIAKHILLPINRDINHVEVRDAIWSAREEILPRWRQRPQPLFPHRGQRT
jgi:hypothetical protein